jgi:hypothetical protein
MTCNVGNADRILRIIIGAIIIAAGIFFKSYWGAVGVIPILTAILKWCPLYIPLKINTNIAKK